MFKYDLVVYIGVNVITACIPRTTSMSSFIKKELSEGISDDDLPKYLKEYFKVKGFKKIDIQYAY